MLLGNKQIINALSGTPILFQIAGTESMRLDSSGNLGIGVTSVLAKLHTSGSLQLGNNATATNNWHITAEHGGTDGSIRFWNGNYGAGTERMRIDTNGNIGIGGAASRASTIILDAQRSVNADLFLAIRNSNAGALANSGILIGNDTQEYAVQMRLMSAASTNYTGGNSFIIQNGYGSIGLYAGAAGSAPERLRIATTGAVTVTSNATKNLFTFTASNNGRTVSFAPDLAAGGYNSMSRDGDQGIIFTAGTIDTGSFVIAPHASQPAGIRITAGGNVSISTVATPNTNDTLLVGNQIGTKWVTVDGGNSGTSGGGAFIVRNAGSARVVVGNYSAIVGGAYNATATLYTPDIGWAVLGLGSGVGNSTMKYNTSTGVWTYDTSSARFKENIRDSQYGLAAVLALQPRQFNFVADGREDVGFVAEEVVEVIPELAPLDGEGLPVSVSYDRLTSVLCKALQELNAKVDALQAEKAALEARIEALENA